MFAVKAGGSDFFPGEPFGVLNALLMQENYHIPEVSASPAQVDPLGGATE
jgi:hypothetical protein